MTDTTTSPHGEAPAGKCPVDHGGAKVRANRDWWPNQLRTDLLNQHSSKSNPLDSGFSYREAFKKLDYAALKNDLRKLIGPPVAVGAHLGGAMIHRALAGGGLAVGRSRRIGHIGAPLLLAGLYSRDNH